MTDTKSGAQLNPDVEMKISEALAHMPETVEQRRKLFEELDALERATQGHAGKVGQHKKTLVETHRIRPATISIIKSLRRLADGEREVVIEQVDRLIQDFQLDAQLNLFKDQQERGLTSASKLPGMLAGVAEQPKGSSPKIDDKQIDQSEETTGDPEPAGEEVSGEYQEPELDAGPVTAAEEKKPRGGRKSKKAAAEADPVADAAAAFDEGEKSYTQELREANAVTDRQIRDQAKAGLRVVSSAEDLPEGRTNPSLPDKDALPPRGMGSRVGNARLN